MQEQLLHFPLQAYKAAIILNGVRSSSPFSWCDYQHVIVVDGAWNDFYQLQNKGLGVTKQVERLSVLGDGDSIVDRPEHFIETPNQYMTDFEKALLFALDLDITQADVYWASGGEMDHFLGNLSVAAKYTDKILLRFIDDKQCYGYLSSPIRLTFFQGLGRTLSVYPFPDMQATSQGLAYQLDGLPLSQTAQQSLRNSISEDCAYVDVIEGSGWFFVDL